ncbi:MAG: hypothetical protein ICV85_14035 [Tolypothrix sp. T3-bin4]|nr:hypothetical protein [Tolypothrix sp. T3-bin4]
MAWKIEQRLHDKIDPLPFIVAFWYEADGLVVLDRAQPIYELLTGHSTQSGNKFVRELSQTAILRKNDMNLCTKPRHYW